MRKCSAVRRTDLNVRRALLVAVALSFATVDLVHKLIHDAEFHHERSSFTVLVIAAVVVALTVLVPRIPSNVAALGAGIACGGALGNLVSLLAWSDGVPDPIVVYGNVYGIAFNLADVFALAGDALLLSATVVHGLRHRGRLRERI
jgi:Signal peptidase (SPase) II